MRKLNRGITLIALIITIIILLILAGITISFMLGENGLITKAILAKEEYEIQEIKERIELKVVEYEANLRTNTIYYYLGKVEELESITPDNAQEGLPYQLVVKGYRYEVRYQQENSEAIEVVYLGKDNGAIPEIKKYEIKMEANGESANIEIEAETKDRAGIVEIELIRNDVVIAIKQTEGKKIKETMNIRSNGRYQIRVKGQNGKIAISDEKEVQGIVNSDVTGSIIVGTEVNNTILAKIEARSSRTNIKKIEIYVGNEKQEEQIFEEDKQIEEVDKEIATQNFGFYEDKKVYVIVEDNKGTRAKSNEVDISNRKKIRTEADIKKLAEEVNKGNDFSGKIITQEQDIRLNQTHKVIGSQEQKPYRGIYDGQNKRIENMTYNSTNTIFVGLFGYIEEGEVRNVILGNGSIQAHSKVGGIVGKNKGGKITNCKNEATTINGNNYTILSGEVVGLKGDLGSWSFKGSEVGGIVGENENGNIRECTNKATISSLYGFIGGIVGYDMGEKERTIENCTNTGVIQYLNTNEASYLIGGIVGLSYHNATIINCKNEGIIKGNKASNVGGIAGCISSSIVNNCVNTASVTSEVEVGGIVGGTYKRNLTSIASSILNCTNSGTVLATGEVEFGWEEKGVGNGKWPFNKVAGIVGYIDRTTVTQCINQGKVEGSGSGVGGIIGVGSYNSTITKSYNTGNIKGQINAIGGIAGFTYSNIMIKECYNAGSITGSSAVGGIGGYLVYTTIENCYNNTAVTATNGYGGGIIGYMNSSNNGTSYWIGCYSTGNISGKTKGTVGGYCKYTVVDYIYSLENATLPMTAQYGTTNTSGSHIEILSISSMKSISIVNKLNERIANIWTRNNNMNNGYPILRWQLEK